MDTKQKPETTLTFEDNVLAKITGKTADAVDGILSLEGNLLDKVSDRFSKGDDPTQGVNVDIDEDDKVVKLQLDAILEYGKDSQAVFDKLISKVTAAVKEMTNLQVTEIKLNVKDMLTREEWAEKNKEHTKDEHPEPDKAPEPKP